MAHEFNGKYTAENLEHIAFPIGGLGAGMFCLEGAGALGSFSIENKPDIGKCPNIFAAINYGEDFRVLEGPVPARKITGPGYGGGLSGKNYGLPRFSGCEFTGRFPFAEITLFDERLPLKAAITGWSPFAAGQDFISSLPFGVLDYEITNISQETVNFVFYFQSENWFGDGGEALPILNGFLMRNKTTSFCAFTDKQSNIDTAWFRGGWWDAFTMAVNGMKKAECLNRAIDDPTTARGATISIPFTLEQGKSWRVRLFISWFSPESDLTAGKAAGSDCGCGCACRPDGYKPWYSAQFADIFELNAYIKANIEQMEKRSLAFSDAIFSTKLPPSAMEAVSANLSILKSPTLLRVEDGRLWGWEGCHDDSGCCHGSCTHVYNYAQAICRLFPELERGLRRTEFFDSQDESGHQQFRTNLPISTPAHDFFAASDGQLGGIVKVYREWKISGDKDWLAEFYPKVKQSLQYCQKTWDPRERGVLTERHHNTYDIEFYGADIMCTGFYLAALSAMAEMAEAMGDEDKARYTALSQNGRKYAEEKLFNGEYFFQEADISMLDNPPTPKGAPEERELFDKEGPKYQYGTGCLSDGLVGVWLAKLSGLPDILDPVKINSHLKSIYKYNFKADLSGHANPQRPGYALGKEAGLLCCTWPMGGKPSLPFVYSDEVWTGIEYEIASYLIMEGFVDEGLDIVKAARGRYDGRIRNPFDEYECGHWYIRALSSYALIQAFGADPSMTRNNEINVK